MSGTLFALDQLDTPFGFAMAGLIGVLFGIFLEQAGFGSSRRLTGIFYFQDMAVLKVMFTAVVTAMIGYTTLTALGWLKPAEVYPLETYWGAQAVGGLIFGAGFVIGGWCPGTALVGVASAKLDAVVFLAGAAIGSIMFSEFFDAVAPLYSGACAGAITLGQSLHVPNKLLVVAFAAVAALAFAGSTWLEQKFGGAPAVADDARKRHRWAAAIMIGAALIAVALPSGTATPQRDASPAQAPAEATGLLAEVAQAEDHIEPLDLAERLMRGEKDLTVVDIRPEEDYRRFSIRGAINIPLEQLESRASALPRKGTVVLYSNGTTHAAQAWMALRNLGISNVLVLTDGILAFWRACLTPPSLSGVSDERSSAPRRAAFEARRAYFIEGKTPQSAAPPQQAEKALVEPGLDKHVVSTSWLSEQLGKPGIRILDVRAKSTSYTTGHIPGAVYLNHENIRGTVDGVPAMVLPGAEIAAIFGRLGVSQGDTVVIYSDALRDSTLVAVALERVGHKSFAVLNGGYDKWVAEKRPVTRELPRVKSTPYPAPASQDAFTVTTDDVAAAVSGGRVRILDVRPPDFFTGKKSDEARPGRIPGAINREFVNDLVKAKETWKDVESLSAAYAAAGIGPDKPTVVHCRTGHQASQTYFLLKHVLGHKDVRWYDGSWSAWASRPDLPAETGEAEKTVR